jgi:LysM repeat protein
VPGDTSTAPSTYDAITERYSYDADGRITTITQATSVWQRELGIASLVTPEGAQTVMATTAYDLLGRVLSQVEYGAGFATYERYDIQYDLRGQVLAEKSKAYQPPKAGSNTPSWTYTHSVNYYNASGNRSEVATPLIRYVDQMGTSSGSLLVFNETKQWTDDVQFNVAAEYGRPASNSAGWKYTDRDTALADTYASNSYAFWDSAVQAGVTLVNRDGTSTSTYAYDLTGHVTSVSVGGPRAHVVSFTNDAAGQVIERRVSGGPDAVTPRQYYYYMGGIQIGASGNNGNDAPDLATSMAERIAPPAANAADVGIFRNATQTQSPFADFDQAYDAVTTSSLSAGPGSYTVRAGETLSTIAATLWGDASLWYKLAEANGLSGGGAISAGQTLTIPNTLSNMHNNADTFRPYDANTALGDTQPGTPKPPKQKCSVIGAILLAVVAIAVAAVTAGAAIAVLAPAAATAAGGGIIGGIVAAATLSAPLGALVVAGAVGGAVGSIVSQGLGVATGLQDRFSWKGVALAAIGGGVGAGVGKLGIFASLGKIGSAVANGIVASAITQGIGVATKLQDKFSWAGVAAAGVAAGVGAFIGDKLNIASILDDPSLANIGANLLTGAARVVASAATRTLIEGSDFGDNVIAGLPDVIGQTIADTLVGSYVRSEAQAAVNAWIEAAKLGDAQTGGGDAKTVKINGKFLNMTPEQFANALASSHSPETRAKVAKMWAEGQNLPNFKIGDLKTANAKYDPTDGEFGTITLNARLLATSNYKEGFGSLAAWGVLEEIGHWADRQAHKLEGNPLGNTPGDEGGRFAYAAYESLSRGSQDNMVGLSLGTMGGQAVSFKFDKVVLKGIANTLNTNGYMDQEHRIGNVEMYHPDGHYVGTFLNAMGVGLALGMNESKIGPIATELALGSQLPDMLAQFDAKTLAENYLMQTGEEKARGGLASVGIGKRRDVWTQGEQQHLNDVYRALHGMPATEAEATVEYLTTERAKTSKYVSEQIADKHYLEAGVAIHRLADLYAHVRPDGRPFWGIAGHGGEDAPGYIGTNIGVNGYGRSPDLLFYKPNFKRYVNEYMPALDSAISIGLKNGRMAQNMNSEDSVVEITKTYFTTMVDNSDAKIARSYDYGKLMAKEGKFVNYIVGQYKGYNLTSYNVSNSTGARPEISLRAEVVNSVMKKLNK